MQKIFLFILIAVVLPLGLNAAEKSDGKLQATWLKDSDVKPPVCVFTVIKEETDGDYVYETQYFKITSDTRIPAKTGRVLARQIDVLPSFCATLPFPMRKLEDDKKLELYIFTDSAKFVSAGGKATSAGVYITSKDKSLFKARCLGLVKKKDKLYPKKGAARNVFSHEIVHQLTPHHWLGSGVWFSEGIAEYISWIPQKTKGGLLLKKARKNSIDVITKRSVNNKAAWNLGKKITMPRMEAFLKKRDLGYKDYPYMHFVFHYFVHYDMNGEMTSILSFLDAIKKNPNSKRSNDNLKHLLQGRTFEELEKDFVKYWKKQKIQITFK